MPDIVLPRGTSRRVTQAAHGPPRQSSADGAWSVHLPSTRNLRPPANAWEQAENSPRLRGGGGATARGGSEVLRPVWDSNGAPAEHTTYFARIEGFAEAERRRADLRGLSTLSIDKLQGLSRKMVNAEAATLTPRGRNELVATAERLSGASACTALVEGRIAPRALVRSLLEMPSGLRDEWLLSFTACVAQLGQTLVKQRRQLRALEESANRKMLHARLATAMETIARANGALSQARVDTRKALERGGAECEQVVLQLEAEASLRLRARAMWVRAAGAALMAKQRELSEFASGVRALEALPRSSAWEGDIGTCVRLIGAVARRQAKCYEAVVYLVVRHSAHAHALSPSSATFCAPSECR